MAAEIVLIDAIRKVLRLDLYEKEASQLRASAAVLQKTIAALDLS